MYSEKCNLDYDEENSPMLFETRVIPSMMGIGAYENELRDFQNLGVQINCLISTELLYRHQLRCDL